MFEKMRTSLCVQRIGDCTASRSVASTATQSSVAHLHSRERFLDNQVFWLLVSSYPHYRDKGGRSVVRFDPMESSEQNLFVQV